jgi:hypothetical protein
MAAASLRRGRGGRFFSFATRAPVDMRGLVDVFGRATLWDLSAYRCLSQPEGRIPQVLCNCNARSAHFSRFPHPFAHKLMRT